MRIDPAPTARLYVVRQAEAGVHLESYSRWYDYTRARDAMLAATDTSWAP